jgi:pimeloyl-ACP methyl ester carboxylesterase
MSTAVAAGMRLAYDVRGTGDPLLLIQGLGYGRGGWGALPERLARTHTVVTFDNRGFGDSDKPPGPYTTADLAEDAVAVLDSVGAARAHVVGASLGGMSAQQLALAAPERVDKLVLVCTTPGGDASFPMPQQTVELFAQAQAQTLDPRDALRRFVVNALSPQASSELVDEVLAYRVANPPDPAGWQAQAAAGPTHDVVARLHELRMPTLVIHGTADNVVDARNAELLAERIPNARLELVEGAGHLLFWEHADRVSALIEDFLRE